MSVLLIYLAIGSAYSLLCAWRLLRGDMDEHFPKESLELIKTPYNMAFSFFLSTFGWPYLLYVVGAQGIKVWCFPSFGWIRVGRNTFTMHAWWPWRIGMLFIKKPVPDSHLILGTPYPAIPGRIAYAIVKEDDFKCVWAGHWSIENAKNFRSTLSELIESTEGFNPKTEKEQHG